MKSNSEQVLCRHVQRDISYLEQKSFVFDNCGLGLEVLLSHVVHWSYCPVCGVCVCGGGRRLV